MIFVAALWGTALWSDVANWYWFLPILPALRAAVFLVVFHAELKASLEPGERPQEARAILLNFAGFAFAAYLLLTVEAAKFKPGETQPDLQVSVYFMSLAFVGFVAAYLLDAHKTERWLEEISQSLVELGRGGLLASAAAVLWQTQFSSEMKWMVSVLAGTIWGVNFCAHLYYRAKYLYAERIWHD
ncbi:MAG: hypothetical protein JWO88_3608 [Frankiales bacterium]|nr:hypothetical protein [Frankiales bacterium]